VGFGVIEFVIEWETTCRPASDRRNDPPADCERLDAMPVLSKFYGIVIRMLVARPFDARFHAIYGDAELVVSIWPLKIVQGEAPRRVREMVLEWAANHQRELVAAWHCCQNGLPPLHIEPLV